MDSTGFFANDTWLEKCFRATETFGAIVMMFPSERTWGLLLVNVRGRFELCVVIKTRLFDITSNLPLCSGSESTRAQRGSS